MGKANQQMPARTSVTFLRSGAFGRGALIGMVFAVACTDLLAADDTRSRHVA
jgi:hypothetical protein